MSTEDGSDFSSGFINEPKKSNQNNPESISGSFPPQINQSSIMFPLTNGEWKKQSHNTKKRKKTTTHNLKRQ